MVVALNSTELQVAFEGLSTAGTVFSALNALFGAYVVLFILAIWSTFKNSSTATARLRLITTVLFVFLTAHYITRAILFGQRRSMFQPEDAPFAQPVFSIPIYFVGDVCTTIAGLIADGLLAWRFYVIFQGSRWALYVPGLAVVVNACLGLAGNFQCLTYYEDETLYWSHFGEVGQQIMAAWGWMMFGTNTVLTGLIIGRILYVSGKMPPETVAITGRCSYSTVIAAIVESALVTWLGLLLFGVANVAPHGAITTDLDVGFVASCILPIFFGISQCLMIVRISLATTAPFYTSKASIETGTNTNGIGELGVRIQYEIHTDAKPSSMITSGRFDSELDVNLPSSSDKISTCV